ncbi:ABC transporter ATP-binding protein [Candidatus Contubernalis alkaliaceticus]|uniref:ABC transporter ATP-binding protein n=1 Tax=Candidatus Contubernalis alkaliaceticus TaxID=338645 RepID=UPI001F4BE005|nr:ABC transporter ATP-binding protein [Candidatus Contubernalis alkalaceticus]UNC93099.1 ABC transporter ATP-binding protein [Candidatus Contubernalis alkalaceticus]
MNFFSIIRAATLGSPGKTRRMILLSILEFAVRGMPYGILILAVWEFMNPLMNPGTPLDINKIIYLCLGLLAVTILLFFVTRASYLATNIDSYNIGAQGRVAMAEHIRRLPMGFFNSRDPGDVTAYLLSDYSNIEFMLSHLVPQIIGAMAMPLVILIFLSTVDWRMALAAAAVIPLAVPITLLSGKIITYFGGKHQKTKITTTSRMLEYLAGIRVIKAYNLRGVRFERLKNAFNQLKKESIYLEAGAGPTVILAGVVLNGGLSLLMILGLYLLLGGTLSIPVYIMFLIIATRIYEPITSSFMLMGELNYFKLGVKRIEELESNRPLPEPAEDRELEHFNIEFKDVTFRYYNTEVLKKVSFTVEENSLTALVGPSGSGKTTVTRLIARFWDTDTGSILMGGRDIKELKTERLLSYISIVFQDVYLFNDTIYNNIKVGKKEASREEVLEAAKKAQCLEFIEKLPGGFEAMVGEGGSTLSGGEKQRISIARALLKDAPVVLLDEATASLDPGNEISIQQAIQELLKNKTVIVIAHKLRTIQYADNIIVLNQGKVEESGKHQELLEAGGLYAHLWREQQKAGGWKFGMKEALGQASGGIQCD